MARAAWSEQLGHAAEVIADDGQFQRVMELARPPDQNREAESPVGEPATVPDAQQPERFQECLDVGPGQSAA